MTQQQWQVDKVADWHHVLDPEVVHHEALAVVGNIPPLLLYIVVVGAPPPTFPPIIFLTTTTIVTMLVGRISIHEVGKGDTTVLIGGAWAVSYIAAPPLCRPVFLILLCVLYRPEFKKQLVCADVTV
jgi:hypothetical protein